MFSDSVASIADAALCLNLSRVFGIAEYFRRGQRVLIQGNEAGPGRRLENAPGCLLGVERVYEMPVCCA